MPISPETIESRRTLLVSAARDLIREKAGAGFSMLELAKKAGVSYATPYNLVSTKANLLALVVQEEFAFFRTMMAGQQADNPLTLLLAAVDSLAEHYAEDQQFQFGLFRAAGSAGEGAIGAAMLQEGRALFQDMVRSIVSEERDGASLDADRITDILLRVMRGTVEAWYVDSWSFERFRNELAFSARLILLPAVGSETAARLRTEMTVLQADLDSSRSK